MFSINLCLSWLVKIEKENQAFGISASFLKANDLGGMMNGFDHGVWVNIIGCNLGW